MVDNSAFGLALVGCGMFGRQHANAAAAVPTANLISVVDLDQGRASALARLTGAAVATLETVLADDEIEAVILATPTDTHVTLAQAAIAAGKHVLVEKPVALEVAAFDSLMQASAEAGVVLAAGQSLRFEPTVHALWSSVRGGVLGQPVLFNWVSNSSRPWPTGWRSWQADPTRSGGMPFHLAIHGLDLAIWLMDEPPARVYAQGQDIAARGTGVHDYSHIAVRFESGANALIEYHAGLPGRSSRHQEFRLYGTGGQAGWRLPDDGLLLDADGGRPFTSEAEVSLRRQLAHFIALCRGDEPPLVTPEQVRQALACAAAANQALATGRAVELHEMLEGA